MDTNYSIILENVNKFFGAKHILKDVDLKIAPGSIYGLLGPSGCGKTTTVKVMAGIHEPTSGTAYILGEKMPKLNLMNKIGYMAQSDALYTGLTAMENLRFFGSLYGLPKRALRKRAEEVMDLVGLSGDLDKKVGAYSGGMKRRLSLAIAILHQPPVLILDEPTVGIDPLLRRDIWRELNTLAAQGATLLVTTHVMDEAIKCHQLAMMRGGRIIAQGTPGQLQTDIGASSLEEAFIYYGGENRED